MIKKVMVSNMDGVLIPLKVDTSQKFWRTQEFGGEGQGFWGLDLIVTDIEGYDYKIIDCKDLDGNPMIPMED